MEQSFNTRKEAIDSSIGSLVEERVKSLCAKTNKIQTKWLFIAYIIVSLAAVAFSWWSILQYSAHVVDKMFLLLSLLMIIPAIFLCVVLLCRWRTRPDLIFVIVGTPVLEMFALFIMPNQIPDEIWHIYRIFDLRFVGDEMLVPESIARGDISFPISYADLYSSILTPADWDNKTAVHRDLSSYLVQLYLLPSIVVHLCEFMNINPFVAIILARLANAALFTVAGFWMIRRIPLGKTLLCVYLLNPMLLQQEASCSADVIVNIASLMFVCDLLYLKYKDTITVKDKVILVALLICMSLSKYVYALLGLLLLLLVPRIKQKKTRICIYVSTALFVFGCALLVLLFYNGSSYYETIILLRDPSELFKVLLKTLYEVGPLWIKETFGLILGALNISVWEPCFLVYCLILFASAVFNLGETISFRRVEKVFLVVLTIAATLLTIVIWREWTLYQDHRSDIIMGAQGRYFIPFFILPLLSAISPRASLYRKNVLVLFSIILIIIYFIDAFFIVRTFV